MTLFLHKNIQLNDFMNGLFARHWSNYDIVMNVNKKNDYLGVIIMSEAA